MALTIADLEKMGQEYPVEDAVRLSIRDMPSIPDTIPEIEYISMQLNGRNPIDAKIIENLRVYKERGKSQSGLIRLLLYHYFTFALTEG